MYANDAWSQMINANKAHGFSAVRTTPFGMSQIHNWTILLGQCPRWLRFPLTLPLIQVKLVRRDLHRTAAVPRAPTTAPPVPLVLPVHPVRLD